MSLAALAWLPASGLAADLTVNKTADTDDGTCGPSDCSLREAIGDAGDGDTVIVPAGTYAATMIATNATFTLSADVTIAGAGAGQTIIDANGLQRTFAIYDQVVMRGVTVTGGKASAGCSCGGGLQVRQGAFLTLEDAIVRGNSASGGGGGINVDSSSRAIVSRTLVSQNSTSSEGGGVRVQPVAAGGTLAMRDVTISGNTATGTGSGAGLANEGSTTASNLTVSGNAAATDAGGILNGPGTLALTNSTIAANVAGASGAGISNSAAAATATLRNTIVADGCAGSGSPPVSSLGNNLDATGTCGFAAAGDVVGSDPLLGSLADNGGTGLLTHALLPGSPAIDAASNPACPAADARGVVRPIGSACDIGAFESEQDEPFASEFSFGKLKRNRRSGTARLAIEVSGPGELALTATKKVKGADKTVEAMGETKLSVVAKGKAKRRLRDTGRVKLRLRVSFAAAGGKPVTKVKRVTLVRRR